jgi:hypothetical protein
MRFATTGCWYGQRFARVVDASLAVRVEPGTVRAALAPAR